MKILLQSAFYDGARKHPHNAAIISEHGFITTYQQLYDASLALEDILRQIKYATASGQTFVGILSHVNAAAIAALLGILQSGKAYVPLDTLYSANQLIKVIRSTDMEVIVVDRALLPKFWQALYERERLTIVSFGEDSTFKIEKQGKSARADNDERILKSRRSAMPSSDDLAYVLHTSGSTGEPKGIMLSHRNAMTFVRWMGETFEVTEQDRVMSRAPLKFDLSVFDIFNTLSVGASLICFNWNEERTGNSKHIDYVRLLEREYATLLYTTPSTLITLREKGGLFNSPNHLRTIMYAGEPFPVTKLAQIMHAAPQVKVANIYGPTETNIITFHWVSNDDLRNGVIPLGQVVDDTEILVMREDGLKECAPGEIGEIWCRGGTVTLGYLNRPDLTQQCRINSPFHPYPTHYWKTGDYGYRDEQGLLYYRGRRDHMHKVNGYRIEIGEIEEATAKVPFFEESCVTIEDRGGQKKIVCHYALKNHAWFDLDAATTLLKAELQSFKVPAVFIGHQELPKTSSGKIDRLRLQEGCGMGTS